jgi:PAS domain S-box-containing protein
MGPEEHFWAAVAAAVAAAVTTVLSWYNRKAITHLRKEFKQELNSALVDVNLTGPAEGLAQAVVQELAVLIADLDTGAIIWASPRAETMFRYLRGEMVNRSVDNLVPLPKREVHVRHRAEYRSNPRTRPMGVGLLLEGQRKDGSIFPAEIALTAMVMTGRKVVVAVVHEMTMLVSSDVQTVKALSTSQKGTSGGGSTPGSGTSIPVLENPATGVADSQEIT